MDRDNRNEDGSQQSAARSRSLISMIWNPYTGSPNTEEALRLAIFVYRVVVIVWLMVLLVWVCHLIPNLGGKLNPEEAGQFGDTFGSVNALFSGLALVGVLYAVVLQHKELEDSRKQAESDERERTKQKVIDAQMLKHQAQQTSSILMTAKLNAYSSILDRYSRMYASVSGNKNGNPSITNSYEELIRLSETCLRTVEFELEARHKIIDAREEDVCRALETMARKSFVTMNVCWRVYYGAKAYPNSFFPYVDALFSRLDDIKEFIIFDAGRKMGIESVLSVWGNYDRMAELLRKSIDIRNEDMIENEGEYVEIVESAIRSLEAMANILAVESSSFRNKARNGVAPQDISSIPES